MLRDACGSVAVTSACRAAFTGTDLINRKHNILKRIITPCRRLSEIRNVSAFLRINLSSDYWFTVNQLQYSMFSWGGKSRLIWLIFHKAYKGRGHSRLFRLFVLGQYYTARLSCCAVVLQSPHSTRAQCQDKALDAKSVYLRLRCL